MFLFLTIYLMCIFSFSSETFSCSISCTCCVDLYLSLGISRRAVTCVCSHTGSLKCEYVKWSAVSQLQDKCQDFSLFLICITVKNTLNGNLRNLSSFEFYYAIRIYTSQNFLLISVAMFLADEMNDVNSLKVLLLYIVFCLVEIFRQLWNGFGCW